MKTMFDAVNINNLPTGAEMVAGYVNGLWPTYHELQKRHPHAQVVSISISADTLADVLDVEKYDATATQSLGWARAMRAKRRPPIIYTSAANVNAVLDVFTAAGEPHPYLWVAEWNNEPHLYPGSVATQWANGTHTYPGLADGCDTSLVSELWPTSPTPKLKGNTTMKITPQYAGSLFRQLAAYAGIATQFANSGHLPASVRTAIISVSGVILAIEHYTAKP